MCHYHRNYCKVHKMILQDRRLKVRGIVEAVGMSSERTYILSEELGMGTLSAKWVTRILTLDQKRMGVEMFEEC